MKNVSNMKMIHGGDYREVYCKKCWIAGEKYRKGIDMYESVIRELYDEWYKECE